MKTRGEPALQGRDPVKSSILPGGCIGDSRWPRVLKMLRDRLVALLRRIPGFLRAVANNKKGWHLRVAISLLSLLSANVAFCLDGEAILRHSATAMRIRGGVHSNHENSLRVIRLTPMIKTVRRIQNYLND